MKATITASKPQRRRDREGAIKDLEHAVTQGAVAPGDQFCPGQRLRANRFQHLRAIGSRLEESRHRRNSMGRRSTGDRCCRS